jgi:hypothetical protein
MFSMGGFGALAKASTLKARKELDWFAAESLTQQHPSRMKWWFSLLITSPLFSRRDRGGLGMVNGQKYAEIHDYTIFDRYLPPHHSPITPRTKLHVLDVGAHDTSWARSLQIYLTNYELEFFQIEGNLDHASALEDFGHTYCLSLVGDIDEEIVEFHKSIYPGFTTGNSIYRELSRVYEHDTIERRTMFRLDTLLDAATSAVTDDGAVGEGIVFDLVKYDVQGSEKKALLGSAETLKKIQSGMVIIESALLPVNGGTAASLLDIQLVMDSFGFQIIGVLSEHYLITDTGFQFVQIDAVYMKQNRSVLLEDEEEMYSWPPVPA